MPTRLSKDVYEVLVEYRSFCLLAYPSGEPDPRLGPGTDDLVEDADGGLWLMSAGNDHYATVAVERWDAEPDLVTSTDVIPKIRPFHTESGRIALTSTTGDLVTPLIEVPPGSVTARVGCTGRDEALRRFVAHEMWFRDVERWTIQLWPG